MTRFLATSLTLLLLAAALPSASATTMHRFSLSELNYVADLVVEATVVSNQVERVEGAEYLRTATTLRLTRVVKDHEGSWAAGDELDVLSLGGRLNGEETTVASSAVFVPEERVLLFLEQKNGAWRTIGMSQSKYTLVEEEDTGRDVLVKVQPPRGLDRFDERAVQLPAARRYSDDVVGLLIDELLSDFVPEYRQIPALDSAKELRFRADALRSGQQLDARLITSAVTQEVER